MSDEGEAINCKHGGTSVRLYRKDSLERMDCPAEVCDFFTQSAEKLAAHKRGHQTEPLLGLATTRQMLEELETRFRLANLPNAYDAVAWMLTGLNETNLEYRTVDY